MTLPATAEYRPDIDGLRAVAVAAVVGYHAAPAMVPGGFVGVDIFFVISGFLISSIIWRELGQGTFSLLNFYARRIRRLFPALVAVLAVACVLGWCVLLPHEFQTFGKHLSASAAYYINITLKQESGYFDTSGDLKLLLHLWSLAVEEQFYLVWPLLLLALNKRKWTFLVLCAVVAASFMSSIAFIGRKDAFFLPHNRVWELASGAALAFAVLRFNGVSRLPHAMSAIWRRCDSAFARDFASCAGLIVIAVSIFGLDRNATYPGFWVLLPVTGALLLIASGRGALVNRKVLSLSAPVFIGLISYPLYLWHWPLLSFAAITGLNGKPAIRLAAVIAALVLATFTYYFIERPIRHRTAATVPVALFATVLTFFAVGLLAQNDILHARLNGAGYRAISAAVKDWAFPDGLTTAVLPSGLTVHRTTEGNGTVVFAGDSNMEQYWPRIHWLLDQSKTKRPVIFATAGGCPAIPGFRRKSNGGCAEFGERVLELAKDPQVEAMVLGGLWAEYLAGDNYYMLGHAGDGPENLIAFRNELVAALANVVRTLRQQGKTVWVILNIPNGANLSPMTQFKRTLFSEAKFGARNLDRLDFEKGWAPNRAKITAAVEAAGAKIIDPMDWLCDAKVCPGQTADGQLMYKDSNHLSASYVREHATFIDPAMLDGHDLPAP